MEIEVVATDGLLRLYNVWDSGRGFRESVGRRGCDNQWMPEHSCAGFDQQMQWACDTHDDPMDCPDALVVYQPSVHEYGIPVRDGVDSDATSTVKILFCPWCGAKLAVAQDEQAGRIAGRPSAADPALNEDLGFDGRQGSAIETEEEAGRAALVWVNEVHWKGDWLEPSVRSVDDLGDFWCVCCVSQQVVVSDGSKHRFDVSLLVEKATGWVGLGKSLRCHPKPGYGSWDEVTSAWRDFVAEIGRFRQRPDADDILRANARSWFVGEIVFGSPTGWDTRDQLASEFVGAAVAGKDSRLGRARELLHLLPPDVAEAAVGGAVESWPEVLESDEREYQLWALTLVCAELVLGGPLDRLIELAQSDDDMSETLENTIAIRSDPRWGKRYSAWRREET